MRVNTRTVRKELGTRKQLQKTTTVPQQTDSRKSKRNPDIKVKIGEAEDHPGKGGGHACMATNKDACSPTLVLSCCDAQNTFDVMAKRDGVYNTVMITESDDLRSSAGKRKAIEGLKGGSWTR